MALPHVNIVFSYMYTFSSFTNTSPWILTVNRIVATPCVGGRNGADGACVRYNQSNYLNNLGSH